MSIDLNNYHRITDTIIRFSKSCALKFIVNLGYNLDNNMRQPFHKEFEMYDKNHYNRKYTITRNFDYYFSLECGAKVINDIDDPSLQYFKIAMNNIIPIRLLLKRVYNWFNNLDKIYLMKNGKIVLSAEAHSMIEAFVMSQKSFIKFEPAINVNDDLYEPAVRMYVNTDIHYIELNFEAFNILYYALTEIEMYSAASNMVNYIQRPELGSNLISFIDSYDRDTKKELNTPVQKTGRKPNQNYNVFTKRHENEDSR